MGEESLALVLTSLLALVSQGVTRGKSSTRWESPGFFVLAYCCILPVELKLEVSAFGTEGSIPELQRHSFPL